MKIAPPQSTYKQLVHIPVNGIELEGELHIPTTATGLVIFAHGSGSSRHSPRNMFVAENLHKAPLATLLVDLLSETEDHTYENRFDIALLTERLVTITDWVGHNPATEYLRVGYFGASTGAAAAIIAAIAADDVVKALVLRGGRVDLAYKSIHKLNVPTLLVVGELDTGVREANEEVFLMLTGTKELAVIPHATHLFEEPGTLDRVAEVASVWFKTHLGPYN